MRETRLPRLLSAVIGAAAVGVVAASGWGLGAGAGTGAGGSGDSPPSGALAVASPGPSRSASASPSATASRSAHSRSATPSPTLTRLTQPASPYPRPRFPHPPKRSAAELTRIRFQLAKVAWSAAGYVDRHTRTHCSVRARRLVAEGHYRFSCRVRFGGVRTRFRVTARVMAKKVFWHYTAKRLPVSEKKATYEATRQSFHPAKVTCDVVGLQAVPIGRKDGLTCWVTTPDNRQTRYLGELVPDGSLVFRPE